MGCQCCRMIKCYIYDPSVAVDGRKADGAVTSLYQPHPRPGGVPARDPLGGHGKQKQGFHNLGYSKSSDSTLRLEVDNNHVNHKLHAAPPPGRELHRQGGAPYIIQPEAVGPRWAMRDIGPSQVPVYPDIREYENRQATGNGWDGRVAEREVDGKSPPADETDEGVGGTPEYPCDTGDEGSVLSADVHTSTTSLSSADTKDELALPKTPDVSTEGSGISVTLKSEEEEEREEVHSVTDSMVAEALAALEAATAGEDYE
ncbi:uncharacterized protein [Embiotoca jacksoni]|uniref:uncharacterized protein n=1 Tax=Embiotoca jacksoni TaxID=100190 RepID=UPI0037048043